MYNDPHARPEERNRRPAGTRRTLRLLLDPAQYHADMLAAKASGSGSSSGTGAASEGAAGGVYSSFNLLIRRRGEANNFKAVLATIRDGEEALPLPPQFAFSVYIVLHFAYYVTCTKILFYKPPFNLSLPSAPAYVPVQ